MELNEAVQKFKEFNALMRAYDHAMGIMYYDMETAAPKNAAAGMGETFAALSEVTYKMTVNEENFEILDFLYAHKDEIEAYKIQCLPQAMRKNKSKRVRNADNFGGEPELEKKTA